MASAAPELSLLARDQAFEALYRRYVKDVYHYALALLRNPADAEDVTQTTFMNAYRAFRRGDEIEKPQNWLIKIAHNVARTRYARATRRVKEVPLEDHVEQLAVPEVDKPNLEGVLHALGGLPFNQRAALIMRELEGRSYAEIADTLNVSVSAVETLIFRARKTLRLRASALRIITGVPLPGSLAAFEGGAFVAGGSAIAGTGFLAKAAVALIAGVVATGVGGDKGQQAAAAGEDTPGVASRWAGADRFVVRWWSAPGSNGARTSGGRTAEASGRWAAFPGAGADGLPGQAPGAAGAATNQAGSSGQATATDPARGAKTVTTPITSAVSTAVGGVEETVSSLIPTVPLVQAPEPPTATVPALPAVPAEPTVPTLPVTVPTLPEPPPLPPIPKLP